MIKKYFRYNDTKNTKVGVKYTIKNNEIITCEVIRTGLNRRCDSKITEFYPRIQLEVKPKGSTYESHFGHGKIASESLLRIEDRDECLIVTLSYDGFLYHNGEMYIPHYSISPEYFY